MNPPVKPLPDDEEPRPDPEVKSCPREGQPTLDEGHEPEESSPCQAPPDWYTG